MLRKEDSQEKSLQERYEAFLASKKETSIQEYWKVEASAMQSETIVFTTGDTEKIVKEAPELLDLRDFKKLENNEIFKVQGELRAVVEARKILIRLTNEKDSDTQERMTKVFSDVVASQAGKVHLTVAMTMRSTQTDSIQKDALTKQIINAIRQNEVLDKYTQQSFSGLTNTDRVRAHLELSGWKEARTQLQNEGILPKPKRGGVRRHK